MHSDYKFMAEMCLYWARTCRDNDPILCGYYARLARQYNRMSVRCL